MKTHKLRLITVTTTALTAVVAGMTMWANPTYADLSTPAQVSSVANTAAEDADPLFWEQEFPASSYPPSDGESGSGAITYATNNTVIIKNLTSGTKVIAGGSTVYLTGPNTGSPISVIDSSTDVLMGAGPVDTVIQRDQNQVRSMVVIGDASAPTQFSYGITGGSFTEESDGIILARDSAGEAVGQVTALWARDANGASVPTWYSVENGQLILHVDHAGAAYPVVADPSISFGWYLYVRYSKSEVHSAYWLIHNYSYLATGLQAAFCVRLGIPWVIAACVAGMTKYSSSVWGTTIYAHQNNRCVEHRYLYNGILVGWKSYAC